MHDAVAALVRDGDTVAIEGFTHLIGFAAGHEIIRQGRRDLTLCRLTPDLIYDQMIGAGVARKLVFSWLGNPGVGGLHAIRRRIETADPAPLEIEEYSHFGMVGRYTAGAMNLPFFPLRSYFESDLPTANPLIRRVASPYGDGEVYAVPPLRPDVAIIHAQRADAAGDTQVWGLLGCQKEAAFAADARPGGGGGAGRRGGHPGRPQPDDHPWPDRRRGGGPALRRASVVRPGLLRPGQPLLPGVGGHLARPGGAADLARRRGSTARPTTTSTWPAWARSGSTRSGRAAPRRRAPSTTGATDERRRDRRGRLQPLRDDDRRGGPRAGRPAASASSAWACPTSP